MSWTKRQFITAAYEEIGYADYVYDLDAEQMQKALWRLESMIGAWDGVGIRVGYPLADNPEQADLDTETNVPYFSNRTIYTNLAVSLAPTVGKVPTQETKIIAKDSYDILAQRAAQPTPQQFPDTLPSGAGNKPWRDLQDPFLRPDNSGLDAGSDSELEFY